MKWCVLTLLLIVTLCNEVKSQNSYNQELEKAAQQVARKLSNNGSKSVAVLDFENSNKQISELGSWLANVFTTHLENNSNGAYSVKNRTDIEKAIQQIKSETGSGAFDSKTIQRLGEVSGSDVIVYGEITLMDNEITVNIRTKNISLNSAIGGVIVTFAATDGMRTKYDNYIESTTTPSVTASTPSNNSSGEATAKNSKNQNCREKQTGDYCFQNNTKFDLSVSFTPSAVPGVYKRPLKCTLQPGQKQCFFDIAAGAATYKIDPVFVQWGKDNFQSAEGSLYVETCKEKTFVIK